MASVIYTNEYMTIWMGISTETKPTGCEGCFFIEADTKKKWAYTNGTWYDYSQPIF